MRALPPIAATAIVALQAICGEPAVAQAVRGRVLDKLTGLPADRGFVVLVNEAGEEATRALTDSRGTFTLRAPAPGRYRLRSERIGYLLWTSDPMDLDSNQIISLILHVDRIPVRLNAVEVVGRGNRCGLEATEGRNLATVWEEIRKVLNAAVWTTRTRPYFYVRRHYERTIGIVSQRVIQEAERIDSSFYAEPFRSAPGEYLAVEGFVIEGLDSLTYYAPDAKLLVQESFLDGHCFRLTRERKTHGGKIGVVFEPVPRHKRVDVRGVLWVDERSSELEQLEYRYVGGPRALTRNAGGLVAFQGLPSGEWVVRAWKIRTPVLVQRSYQQLGIHLSDTTAIQVREVGGEVLRITGARDSLVYAAAFAGIEGSVYDSARMTALEGARAVVVGTAYATSTDRSGHFRLSVPMEGQYTITFTHPLLDSLGLAPDTLTANLSADRQLSVSLFARPWSRMLRNLCGSLGTGERVLVGTVRRSLDGRTAAGARVFATWDQGRLPGAMGRLPEGELEAVADNGGRYVLCHLPAARRIRVYALVGHDRSDAVGLEFGARTVSQGFLAVPAPDRPIWTLDLDVIPTSVVDGRATDLVSGAGVPDAFVAIEGADVDGATDSSGSFRLVGVPSGENHIQLRRVGYASLHLRIHIAQGSRVHLPDTALRLRPVPVTVLDKAGASDSAKGNLERFHLRRLRWPGFFLTREEWDLTDDAPGLTDILGRVPGIVVRPNPDYLKPVSRIGDVAVLDSRRTLVEVKRGVRANPGGPDCPPAVYIDRDYVGRLGDLDLGDLIPIDRVQAVEVYVGGNTVPAELERPAAGCGLVIIWARESAMGQGGPSAQLAAPDASASEHDRSEAEGSGGDSVDGDFRAPSRSVAASGQTSSRTSLILCPNRSGTTDQRSGPRPALNCLVSGPTSRQLTAA